MPDVYATITQQDDAVVDQLARAMELRATDPRQRAFVTDYLARLALTPGSTVVEIGCGTGAITRLIAAEPAVDHVVGIDPSEGLIARARQLADGRAGIEFHVSDGGATPLGDASADAVVLHTVLSHAQQPDALLVEAHRLLRTGRSVVVFDGDYATLSFALDAHDPLELCADAFRESFINDPYVMRRVAGMLVHAGFVVDDVRSAGYVQIESPDYLLSVLDRGADALAGGATIATQTAVSLKDEARRRIEAGTFFAFVAYLTVIAHRRGDV
jgi:ubiquinone/menaquinone biosynthesis C-methylase UbiE